MDFKERFERGLKGEYQGLANGFDRINDYIFGTQKACYYLLGGQSGTYKSTLADYWILKTIEDADKKGIPIIPFYFSYEIDEQSKRANWMSTIIFNKYKEIIEPQRIKGLGSLRCTLAQQDLVNKEMDYLDYLVNKIKFRFDAQNPTGIFHELWQFAEQNGQIEYEHFKIAGEDKKRIVKYSPNDPKQIVFSVLDHYAKAKLERGFIPKENIDKLSDYFVILRNLFGQSFLALQQFNQGLSSVERMKYQGVDLSPQQSDFKDSTNPFADADVVMGLMNPNKLGLTDYMGYKVHQLGKNLAILKIIKNRLSDDNVAFGLYVDPRKGYIEELPKPSEVNYNKYKT